MVYHSLDGTDVPYDDIDEFVRVIDRRVNKIAFHFSKSRHDCIDDLKQELYIHAIKAFDDTSRLLMIGSLYNLLWWRAIDFTKRDKTFNFWNKHVPYTEHILVESVHSRTVGRYVEEPGVESKLDFESIMDYAASIFKERDFTVLLLSIEGLSFREIREIVYPDTKDEEKAIRRLKSALWRVRRQLLPLMR